MVLKCTATKVNGSPCRNKAIDVTGFCRAHHPHPALRTPTGGEFEEKVLKILRLLGYKVERNVSINGCQIDVFGEYRTGVIALKLMVECKDYGKGKTVGIEEINKFAGVLAVARNTGAVDKGLFVTTHGYTAAAKVNARSAGIELTTYEELSTQLVDFDDYIERVISEFAASSVNKYYIDLSGTEVEDYEGADESIFHRPIDEYVNKILSDVDRRQLALLGNFGTGKSTFCRKYAHDLAWAYRGSKVSRIPIVVNLKDYDSKLHIQQLILNTLQFRYNVSITHNVCQELQRIGRFLFLFDGFDEMSSRVDADTIRDNIQEINKVSEISENKYILTCRTHFFRDKVQVELLTDFDILYIPEWGENELREYLQKRFGNEWEVHLKRISGTHNLPELAQTPLFLEMIVETLPKLGDEVRRIELYKAYTDKWIQDQSRRKGARLSATQRRQFITQLALKLYLEDKLSCHHKEFTPILREKFEIDDAAQIDYLRSDVQTCTFLTRDPDGNYGFRHKSFMEFFVAQDLAEEIQKGSNDLLKRMLLPLEIRGFLVDFLAQEPPADYLKDWLQHTEEQILRDNILSLLPRLRISVSDIRLAEEPMQDARARVTAQFLQGDAEAFDEIYRLYKRHIERVVERRFRQSNLSGSFVEDVVIETFFLAWQYKDRMSSPDNLLSYLIRIAANKCSDMIRRERRGTLLSWEDIPPKDVAMHLFKSSSNTERDMIESFSLKEAIERLSNDERYLVELLLNDMTLSEIAQQLGVTPSTVARRRRSVYDKMKQYLKEQ